MLPNLSIQVYNGRREGWEQVSSFQEVGLSHIFRIWDSSLQDAPSKKAKLKYESGFPELSDLLEIADLSEPGACVCCVMCDTASSSLRKVWLWDYEGTFKNSPILIKESDKK